MLPVSAVPAHPEGVEPFQGAEAPGRGIVWKGHVGIAQEERSVHNLNMWVTTYKKCKL